MGSLTRACEPQPTTNCGFVESIVKGRAPRRYRTLRHSASRVRLRRSSQSKTLFPILDDGFRDGFPRGGNRYEGRKPSLGFASQGSDRDELVESTLVCPGSSFAQWSQLGDGLASFGYAMGLPLSVTMIVVPSRTWRR